MVEPSGAGSDLLFRGCYSYRRHGSLLGPFLSIIAAASGLCLVVARPASFGVAGAVLVVIALIVLFVGAALFWARCADRAVVLTISPSGVSYGREHWEWKAIAAIRILPLPSGASLGCIEISLARGFTRRRRLAIDAPITEVDHARIVETMKNFVAANPHIHLAVE